MLGKWEHTTASYTLPDLALNSLVELEIIFFLVSHMA